jgi:DNA modification methylase
MSADVIHGDCVEVLARMAAGSVDAVICDPPYGLAFMGKEFDTLGDGPAQQAWHHRWMVEAFRVLRPGGTIKAFSGTRTYHRLAAAMEEAGFVGLRMEAWVYGSGFPKSHDMSKSIDKAAGIWRGKAGVIVSENGSMSAPNYERTEKGDPVTDAARRWSGWGTALKPAWEPVLVGMKP